MRQTFRERRQHLHRGLPMPRLLTMLLMLAILGLIFVRLRDPSTWRLFAGKDEDSQFVPEATSARSTGFSRNAETKPQENATTSASARSTGFSRNVDEKPPEGGTTSAAPPELAATGPTDLDAEERDDIKDALSVLSDGSLDTKRKEQPAYFRILEWVDHQPTELLRKRAIRDFFYDTLVKSPDAMRLQIVELKLTVMQIARMPGMPKDGKPQPLLSPEGKQLYEVRGVSRESGSNIYFAIVTDIPPGMPIGTFINEDARLVGYFFKVQGYFSQQQQLEFELSRKKIKPLKAPLIIGRLIWSPRAAAADADSTPVWLLAPVGGLAILAIIGWVYWNSRSPRRTPLPRITTRNIDDPDAPSVDTWLDQAQTGRFSAEPVPETTALSEGAALDMGLGGRFLGNIFAAPSESNIGDRSSNGHAPDNGNSGPEPEVRENDSPGK